MTLTRAFTLLTALSGAVLLGSEARAAEASDFYFSASTGPMWRARATDSAGSTTFKTGFTASGALGYRFGAQRLEAEYTYFANDCDTTDPAGPAIGVEPSSGDADGSVFMANYYYDFAPIAGRFQPFVGGGLGSYRVSINGLTTPSLRTLPAEWGGPVIVYAKSSWTLAYQVRCGVKYRLTERADVLLGYRYLKGSDMDINLVDGSTIHPNAKLHGVDVALHISF
ncbi:hypothetical protein DB347_21645 [Opitutaceae bacterium EW11]|nr:hypothetical protein DB347_21645 [Opitutaceae bacterium EW11]